MVRFLALLTLWAGCACRPLPFPDDSDGAGPPRDLGADLAALDLAAPDLVSAPALALMAGEPGGAGVVDGIAETARLMYVSAIVADGAGRLYFNSGRLIRSFEPASGEVVTLSTGPAGGVTARVGGLALDGAGALYYSGGDHDHAIYRMDLASGAVTRVAGAATESGNLDGAGDVARFDGPRGIAFVGGNLYIADSRSSSIRRFEPASGRVSTLVRGLSSPDGMISDGAGRLYVVVGGVGGQLARIEIAAARSELVTSPGGGPVALPFEHIFYTPIALAMESRDALLLTDSQAGRVVRLDLASGALTTVAGAPRRCQFVEPLDGAADEALFATGPFGIALDGPTLYVSDGDTLRKLDRGLVSTVAGRPYRDRFDEPGAPPCQRGRATSMALGDDGAIYLVVGRLIRRLDPDSGALETVAGSRGEERKLDGIGTAALFGGPQHLVHSDGKLYVSDGASPWHIRRVDLATRAVTTYTAGFGYISALALDGPGHLVFCDNWAKTLHRMDLASGSVTMLSTRLEFEVLGMATDGKGRLWLGDSASALHEVVIATGADRVIAGERLMPGSLDGVGTMARLELLGPMVRDGERRLFLGSGAGKIRSYEFATGRVATLVGVVDREGVRLGPLPAGVNRPASLAMTALGDLLVLDGDEAAIVRVDL